MVFELLYIYHKGIHLRNFVHDDHELLPVDTVLQSQLNPAELRITGRRRDTCVPADEPR